MTSQVSLWYKDHSTENPLGVEPDPTITRTVVGDKFSSEGVAVLEDSGAVQRHLEEVERKMRIDQDRCDWHKSYPGVCNCNKKNACDSNAD